MFERKEPVGRFVSRMAKCPTDEICLEIESNKEAIFFFILELSELDDFKSPRGLELQSLIREFSQDNLLMYSELKYRISKEFTPYLKSVLSTIFKGGSND